MTVAGELVRLRKATLPKLQARYLELTGEELKIRDREEAWKRVARALQSVTMEADAPEPAPLPPLLPASRRRTTKPKRPRGTARPMVGTTLTRIWRNQEIRVRVLADGFEWNGTVHQSLSATAKAITGAHWRGALFFGLVKRKAKARR